MRPTAFVRAAGTTLRHFSSRPTQATRHACSASTTTRQSRKTSSPPLAARRVLNFVIHYPRSHLPSLSLRNRRFLRFWPRSPRHCQPRRRTSRSTTHRTLSRRAAQNTRQPRSLRPHRQWYRPVGTRAALSPCECTAALAGVCRSLASSSKSFPRMVAVYYSPPTLPTQAMAYPLPRTPSVDLCFRRRHPCATMRLSTATRPRVRPTCRHRVQ